MNIAEITVGPRARTDLGDLTKLIESIDRVGLLHPVVVTPNGVLVAGRRRLEACKQLGWTQIPTGTADRLSDALKQLEAERDENTCRKDMTVSERVALGVMLETLERPAAVARQAASRSLPGQRVGEEKFPPPTERHGKVYDLVGDGVGMSGPTYKRAKAVVEAAEDLDATAEVKAIAARMDVTGKVTPAYNALRKLQPPDRAWGNQHGEGESKVDGRSLRAHRRLARQRVEHVARTAHSMATMAADIDVPLLLEHAAQTEAEEWARALTTGIQALSQLRRQINGGKP